MSPADPRHGTEAGYSAHHRDGETPCAPCFRAKNRHDKRRRVFGPALVELPPAMQALVASTGVATLSRATGISKCSLENMRKRGTEARVKPETLERLRRAKVPTDLGTIRRVRALTALGWSTVQIAERSGVPKTTVARLRDLEDRAFIGRGDLRDRIAAAFDEMCMTTPTYTRWSSRLKGRAERNGWAPPLAWDDIDNDESPVEMERETKSDIDPVVVERLLSGRQVDATRAEKAEVVRRWAADGRSLAELERLTGWNTNRYRPERTAS